MRRRSSSGVSGRALVERLESGPRIVPPAVDERGVERFDGRRDERLEGVASGLVRPLALEAFLLGPFARLTLTFGALTRQPFALQPISFLLFVLPALTLQALALGLLAQLPVPFEAFAFGLLALQPLASDLLAFGLFAELTLALQPLALGLRARRFLTRGFHFLHQRVDGFV